MAFPALLPNFSPEEVVSSGSVNPKAGSFPFGAVVSVVSAASCSWDSPSRRIISMPDWMLPHWSDPPIWSVQLLCLCKW